MDKSEYLQLKEGQSGLLAKFKLLLDSELDWYSSEALQLFELERFPSRRDDQLIQQILSKSPNDDKKKRKGKDYYISNALTFIKVLKDLLNIGFIQKFESQEIDDLTIYNYHRIIRNLLLDSLVLLNEYAIFVKNIEPIYGCGKGYQQHTLTIYQSLRQSIYGQSSFHAFREIEPDLAISIIRQLVELRVRRAFGVLGWYEPNSQSIEPLPMNQIFRVLNQYRNDVDFSIPFDCLVRIYEWSNIFLHTGYKESSWKHIFVTNYLNEFALGKAPSTNGWSVNSGIMVKQSVLDTIISELEAAHPKNVEVIRCKPEAELLNT